MEKVSDRGNHLNSMIVYAYV